jgi:hypothetical protein
LLDLLLIVDIYYDATEMARNASLVIHHAATQANPKVRPRWFAQPVLHVEIAASFDGKSHGVFGTLALFIFKQGKEQFVGKRQVARNAKKSPGDTGPEQLLGRKIEIPNTDTGSRDALQKPLVSSGVFGRLMWGGGHVSPSVLR